jgi:PEP-CTERM motif
MTSRVGWFSWRSLGLAAVIIAALALMSASSAWSDTFSLSDGTNLITFSLSASPTPTSFKAGSFAVLDDIPLLIDGVSEVDSIFFYNSSLKGGIAIANPSLTLLNQSGPMIYGGSEQSPTFAPSSFSLANLGGSVLGNAFTLVISDSQSVPEPGTWLLLGMGLLSVLAAGVVRDRAA